MALLPQRKLLHAQKCGMLTSVVFGSSPRGMRMSIASFALYGIFCAAGRRSALFSLRFLFGGGAGVLPILYSLRTHGFCLFAWRVSISTVFNRRNALWFDGARQRRRASDGRVFHPRILAYTRTVKPDRMMDYHPLPPICPGHQSGILTPQNASIGFIIQGWFKPRIYLLLLLLKTALAE